MNYYSIAARLLDAGHVILVTPELGRHRKPDAGMAAHLTVKQMSLTFNHNVMLWFSNGEKIIVHPDLIVKVAA